MCIFLRLVLRAPNYQCREQQGMHVIERIGELSWPTCVYYAEVAHHPMLGPFPTDEAAEAALRVAAQVQVAS